MYGVIIGDKAGSLYEIQEAIAKDDTQDTSIKRYNRRIKIMNPNQPLIQKKSTHTDDTVLTIAVLDATLNNEDYEEKIRLYGQENIDLGKEVYGRSCFGGNFNDWLLDKKPGNSYGNGGAMRVSSIGFLYNDIDLIKKKVREATIPTHNNEESILCAQAVAVSISLLRNGMSKAQLREYLTTNYFSLDYNIEDLRRNYLFTSRAILSVPIAIYAFLFSGNFENAIRIAISCGGDSDTIASITGALAESYYGISEALIKEAIKGLPLKYIELLEKAYQKNPIKERRI